MEPRHDVPKTPEASSETPAQRPENWLKIRFSIEPLEERIAPKKGTGGDPWYPEPY